MNLLLPRLYDNGDFLNVIPACYTCNTVRSNLFTMEEMKKLGKVISQIKKDRKNHVKP